MVCEVKDNGRLMMTQIGGYAWQAIEGENVTVLALSDGKRCAAPCRRSTPAYTPASRAREKREQETDGAAPGRSHQVEGGDIGARYRCRRFRLSRSTRRGDHNRLHQEPPSGRQSGRSCALRRIAGAGNRQARRRRRQPASSSATTRKWDTARRPGFRTMW